MKYILILFTFFAQSLFAQQMCLKDKGKNCMLKSSDSLPSDIASINIFGRKLKTCCKDPMTGWYRDGSCKSDPRDVGNHSVCSILTQEFLDFTKSQGNDLSTPNPRYGFPGLKPKDKWCLCAARWLEAKKAGIELEVDLEATSIRALEVTNAFDFKWKYRVLKCSFDLYPNQLSELSSNQDLTKDLKLVAVPDRKMKGCQLIGLDGGVKKESDGFYKLKDLEAIINSMPMRQEELNSRNN